MNELACRESDMYSILYVKLLYECAHKYLCYDIPSVVIDEMEVGEFGSSALGSLSRVEITNVVGTVLPVTVMVREASALPALGSRDSLASVGVVWDAVSVSSSAKQRERCLELEVATISASIPTAGVCADVSMC